MRCLSLIVLLTVTVCYIEAKPVKEILPHSRDYYAGYIKAITDNFDQLFTNERQTRSTGEDDEDDSPQEKLLEVKRDVAEGSGDEDSKKDEVAPAKEKASAKEEIPKEGESSTGDKSEADKKSKTEEHETTEVQKEKEPEKKSETESNEEEADEKSEDDSSDSEDSEAKSAVPAEVTKDDEEDNAGSEEEEQDSDEDENNEDESENDARRDFILEHARMNAPVFPNIISGYQQGPAANQMYPQSGIPYAGASPYGFGPGMPAFNGEARSGIKADRKDSGCADPHHLQRVLLLPQCCNQCCDHHCCDNHHAHHVHVNPCCCCDSHHCGHHGGHQTVHDIHHAPIGCSEHYSHDSPCLTHPHGDHVGYGFPNDCSCGAYHSHHPVVLHPTHQECHHHNVHVAGIDCHQDCHHNDCHHTCDCCHHEPCHHVDHVTHHINHVEHVYEPCHHVHDCHHGHHGHHGADHGVAVLPHYGHTTAGNSGWNPYWGH